MKAVRIHHYNVLVKYLFYVMYSYASPKCCRAGLVGVVLFSSQATLALPFDEPMIDHEVQAALGSPVHLMMNHVGEALA